MSGGRGLDGPPVGNLVFSYFRNKAELSKISICMDVQCYLFVFRDRKESWERMADLVHPGVQLVECVFFCLRTRVIQGKNENKMKSNIHVSS